jgi:hypothetical protein
MVSVPQFPMNRQRFKRLLAWAALVGIAVGLIWWGLYKLDPTSSAIFISDSPDGKYRCAVFCRDTLFGGHPEYEAGLFEGRWPHRGLPGDRAKWNYDSVSSSDFSPTWQSDGVDINFCTGYGTDRATVSGRSVGGRQEWR